MDDTESIPKLARRLADLITTEKGKSCALVVISGTDDSYAHVATDQILDDAVRVIPGYDIELVTAPHD